MFDPEFDKVSYEVAFSLKRGAFFYINYDGFCTV